MPKKPLVILTGPTAVGKTALSISLAKKLNGEIISADSMQVYKGMDIGTAKISEEEKEGVKHYLIDIFEPDEAFNVTVFQAEAFKAMDEIYAKGKIPIIVGGTGFYIQSVLYDIDFTSHNDNNEYREYLENLADEKGPVVLHKMLMEVDPDSANSIHANNVKKVIRALEFYKLTGGPISKHNEEQHEKESPYNAAYFVLNNDRQLLYDRIDYRVDKMFDDGLLEEVKTLYDKGYDKSLVSMQGLGYKEVLDYFDGISSLEDAKYIIKRDTRHFAKRQLTWFRREKEVIWVNKNEFSDEDAILNHMIKILKEKGIFTGDE